MVDAGLEQNFVDTQGISLTNATDGLTYIQLTDVDFLIDSNVTKHQLTDDRIDNVYSLYMNYIEANITLTTPEVAALVLLTKDVAGVRPTNVWTLNMDNSNDEAELISLNGQVKTLRIIDVGISVTKLFIRIEGDETVTVG